MQTNIYAKLGAVFYGLWALLHFFAAHQVYSLALSQEGIVQGRLLQDAAYLAVISVGVLWFIPKNWKNDLFGYWFNLALVSVADVIFIAIVVAPGYVPLERGLIGPALWLLALGFSTIGIRRRG